MSYLSKWFLSLTLCSTCFSIPQGLYAQFVFNEVLSSNQASFIHEGESPDWIEFLNASENDISLAGLYLSDDLDNPQLWALPNITIPPGDFLLVLADGTNTVDAYYHSNFKVSSSGESLYLFTESGEILQSLSVPSLDQDIAYANIENVWEFASPTPGQANSLTALVQSEPPIFSEASGNKQSSFDLVVSKENDAGFIEYYLNNFDDEPAIFEDPISISANTIICARSVKPNRLPSKFVCQTYLFDLNHDLPVLSILANDHDLFDPITGIFEEGPNASSDWPFLGANFWEDWNSEVLFEYWNTGNDNFQGRGDIAMHGGRESRTREQKTFKLLAKNKYHQAYFDYPFFSDKPEIESFKRLVVRNASGDFNAGHCRDGFLQSYLLSKPLNLDANAYQPIAVYINGAYYGMMGLREKIDKFYLETNYQIDSFDLLEEQIEVVEGSDKDFIEAYEFIQSSDLSEDHLFEKAKATFDLENLADYFISQIGNNSTAWPQNNIKFWKGKSSSAKWRYLLFDMDISLGRHQWTIAEENSLLNKMTSFADTNVFINTFNALMENEEYRNYFFNRHQDIYNTYFDPSEMLPVFNAFVETIDSEMPNHFDRWPSASYENWENVEQEKIVNFINNRPAFAMQYMDEFFELGGINNIQISQNLEDAGTIRLNSLENISLNRSWKYFKGVAIHLEAEAFTGYYFRHWEITDQTGTYTIPINSLSKAFDQDDVHINAIYSTTTENPWLESVILSESTLNIKINNDDEQQISLRLYNTLGQLFDSQTIEQPYIGTHFIRWPVSYLAQGQYILVVNQGDQLSTKRVTKFN